MELIFNKITCFASQNLRKFRLEKDIPEKELSSLLDVNVSTYCRYEKGEIALSKSKAEILASFYKIDLNEIYLDTGAYHVENNIHDSPSSGNVNATIIPSNAFDALVDNMKQQNEIIGQLFKIVSENQQLIATMFQRKQN